MLYNDLVAAFRVLRRQRGYTVVSVLGLALGLACAVSVALYIYDELSYDRFHEHADRIARVELQIQQGNHVFTLPPFGPAAEVVESDGDVEALVRVVREPRVVVRRGDFRTYDEGLVFAPPALLDVFTLPLDRGDGTTALARPHTVVLTPAAARTYFGDEDPIGQTLELGDMGAFEVTGIFRSIPTNSTLRFSMVASLESRRDQPGPEAAYVLLAETGAFAEVAERLLPRITERLPQLPIAAVSVDPLTELHLHSLSPTRSRDLAGNVRYLYLFGGVGLLILLLAAVNFVNLATAQALSRAREVGVRKTLGARRVELIRQYLTEAGMQSALAFMVATSVVAVALPAFNALVGKGITLDAVPMGLILGGAAALWVVTTLLAGLYPAFVLSGYRPALVIKGGPAREGRGGGWLRRGLVVFQFAVTIALLVGLFTIVRQMDHLRAQHLSLAADQVLLLEPQDRVLTQYDAFKHALRALPGVSNVSAGHFPGGIGLTTRLEGEEEPRSVSTLMADADFLDVLGIRMVSGRALDASRPADASGAVLINEAAAREFGWATDPLGRRVHRLNEQFQMVPSAVVGVVEDFPYSALHRAIAPQIITVSADPMTTVSRGMPPPTVLARLEASMLRETVQDVARVWAGFAPDHPFEYTFLDERFTTYYQAEARLQQLFTVFAGLALALACLGLVGLAAYTAERRTKEIGVRKVLGASVASIVALLSREFLALVAAAFLVATPLAYWAMSRWLEDFAYRIELGPAVFAAAGLLAALVALSAVTFHALRAAHADPVDALRSE
jgi:putative ABC transport system permease protein